MKPYIQIYPDKTEAFWEQLFVHINAGIVNYTYTTVLSAGQVYTSKGKHWGITIVDHACRSVI